VLEVTLEVAPSSEWMSAGWGEVMAEGNYMARPSTAGGGGAHR